ncbi:hypothetical protein [Prevotellamassilia timonensis]|uniref:hypothetical protein n=1 Tax=Prevotellamassilia timonensis TaxID=1852370 RepID=UPI001F1FE301|nr:hypothetical protein [Prevotellamassilia timonensis]MCF2634295.1 hypothetical protein [Prevotellamassilia timonensis]
MVDDYRSTKEMGHLLRHVFTQERIMLLGSGSGKGLFYRTDDNKDEFVSVLSSFGEDETRVESRHELTVSIQNREKRGSLQVVVRKKTTFASRIESVTYTLLYIAHHYIAHLHRNILFNNYG